MRNSPLAALRALPLAARLALAVLLPGVLALVVWIAISANEQTMDDVLATKDPNLLRTAEQILDGLDIEHDTSRDGDRFVLLVEGGEATKAAEALAIRGVKDLTKEAKGDTCVKPGSFTSTRDGRREYVECQMERDIRTALILGGAHAAHVTVTSQEGQGVFGDDLARKVTAQVFLSEAARPDWDSATMVESIAGKAGTDPENVTITDQFFHSLGTATSRSAAAASAAPALGCDDLADAREVETKKAAVQGCYRSRLEPELRTLLGERPFALSIEPTIRTAAATVQTTSTTGRSTGTADDEQAAGTDATRAGATSETTTERSSELPAGELTALRISIVVDRAGTSRADLEAVRRILRPAAESAPDSPAPSITIGDQSAAAGAGGTAAASSAAGAAASGTDGNSTGAAASNEEFPVVERRSRVPWNFLAAIGGLVLLLVIGGSLLLIRRLRALDVERQRLEASFQQDQRLFEDFAASNPDAIARELEALFATPPAHLHAV
jgi:hypothetical protein